MALIVTIMVICLFVSTGHGNLFSNPDFESLDFEDNWFCSGDCCIVQDDDAYHGSYSVLVTDRLVSKERFNP